MSLRDSLSSSNLQTFIMRIKMRLKNYTPHTITVFDKLGNKLESFPSQGVARVKETSNEAGRVVVGFLDIPLVTKTYTEIEGLPEPEQSVKYIVSKMVLDASDRNDLIAPDTGEGVVRDETGKILGVNQFVTSQKIENENVL